MPRSGLVRHQVDRGVGDVDRRVVRRHLAGVVGRLVEHDVPRGGRLGEGLRVVHEQVRAVAVRDAVRLAVDRVPLLLLEEVVDALVVRDEVGVDRLDLAAAMSRSVASPEAATTSYSPVFMRLTASSEVP